MPERIDFWGIPENWGSPALYVYGVMFLATGILILRFYLRAKSWWMNSRNDFQWDQIFHRFGQVIKYAVLQTKVLSQRYPGIMHAFLAWSFFVFFIGTGLATIDSHFYKILIGTPYLIHKLIMDIFTIVYLIGAGLAIYRRFIQKPPRLTLSPQFTWSLILLSLIVLGGLITESLRLAIELPKWAWWSPVGWMIANIWIKLEISISSLETWHLFIWVVHLLIVAVTIITLPVTTLFHIIAGPINIFFSNPKRKTGFLYPIPENLKNEPIYANEIKNLSAFQVLNSDACTECGRCQDVCPAYSAGTDLNPKQIILNLRDALDYGLKNIHKPHQKAPFLIGDWVKENAIWACTTCMACVKECPILINHVDTIVDLRRYLVIEGRMDGELQTALENFGRYGNSFGQSDRARAKWAHSIMPKIKDARREQVDYLWFVGDYASYSPSLSEITLKTAEVFNKVGIDYGLIYENERNSGNDIRRIGEEGLYEMLMEKNISSIEKCKFKSIITTDPHSYNTLKNEYNFNEEIKILHYSELLDHLITSGELKFENKLNHLVTFHDPCYLGRYNEIYDSPRRVIKATGCKLIEMPRHADRSFCCGGGGGRIWMNENEIKERPSENRIREAASLEGISNFIVACPKDITMFRDAVKTSGNEEKIIVKDLIELVHESIFM